VDVSPHRAGRHRADVKARRVAAGRITAGGGEAEAAAAGAAEMPQVRSGDSDAPLFTRAALEFVAHRPGQPLTLLQAGCTTAGGDPDVASLRATGCVVAVSLIDDDSLAVRAAVAAYPELASCTLGDLRIAPLPPRSFDIVHCALLLERISNAELVLDRLVEALKPGGLLLLSTGDRDCAAGFLDRVLPHSLRAGIWRSLCPGEPGPYPAVYERLASGRGIQSYVTRHGLVIGPRQALSLLAIRRRPPGLLVLCRLVAWLSGGRLTSAHDQLRYVIRKPESGFARVL